jgi:hypothetical protein
MSLILSQIREDERLLANLESSIEDGEARGAALSYEDVLEERYKDDPSFKVWDRNRALDFQDFDYLFWHRDHLSEHIRTYLEIIASKITHITRDGNAGYFNNLETNVGWTPHITAMLIAQNPYIENLVKCGLRTHSSNSGRCHKLDYCPHCLWSDILNVRMEAFGENSGTFERMQAESLTPFFITLAFTTQHANSKCVGRGCHKEKIVFRGGSADYDAYPVCIGLDDNDGTAPWLGYEDARLLGLIAQAALEKVYKEKLLAGYFFKIEGAFKLVPNGANRVNLHAHSIANGLDDDPQALADALFQLMRKGLSRYRKLLHGQYFPDVLVETIESASDLEKCIRYSEKIIPIGQIVEEAMGQAETKLSDGRWNEEYVSEVQTALLRLIHDDIPAILNTPKFGKPYKLLRRRHTVGNFKFNDKGTCIGKEPKWHKKQRRKKSEKDRETRKKRLAKALQNKIMPSPRRKVRVHRKGARKVTGGSKFKKQVSLKAQIFSPQRNDPVVPTVPVESHHAVPHDLATNPLEGEHDDGRMSLTENDGCKADVRPDAVGNVNKGVVGFQSAHASGAGRTTVHIPRFSG